MATRLHPQRRDFLKAAAVGAAGAAGISALKFDKLFAQSAGNGWVTGMQINPAIDNARVICCNDPNMFTGPLLTNSFLGQNAVVNAAVVDANMDEMAMQLAQKTNAADAWSTIFRTGNAGGWGSTRVAIKTNGIGGNTANRQRVAVIKKVCDVLIGLGVQPSNIVLYDACNDASSFYSGYIDLTDSTKIRAVMSSKASSLGGYAPVTLVNWNPASGTCSCPADLVNGKIDILVNIAVAKIQNAVGGKYSFGAITACMKNHFGTFTDAQGPSASSAGLHPAPGSPPLALFEINQHPAILGGNPVRQQLCIVDALFSSTGPATPPDNVTNRLVMGTFAPMVDYFTANYILLNPAVMTTTPVPQAAITAGAAILPQFATSFGYAAPSASPTAPDPSWVSYPASNPPPINPSGSGGTGGSGGAGSGGASGSRDAGGGGSSGSADAGSGLPSGSQDAGGGGTSVSVDAGGGGSSGSADAGSGLPSGSADAGGGTSGSVDAGGGLPSGSADAASGGTPSGAGGAGGTGDAATSPVSPSADAATPGGTGTGTGTAAIPPGGGGGTTGSTAASGKSGGGCDIAGVDRGATRWGAMLAFGAVVAEKLRRLVGGNDRSS